jgi:hypothetical protein
MAAAHLFQIYYDEVTKSKLDPGFIPLDNTENIRPDWYEYLPIRQCFSSLDIRDDEYFGVFSPKFFEKTGMTSHEIRKVMEKTDADVISFSPWYAHLCVNRNIFIQADIFHPGAKKIFEEAFLQLDISLDIDKCVMSSEQAILCNYFIAKKWVWDNWLSLADKIFELAELKNSSLGIKLCKNTNYPGTLGAPMKIFIIERLMSALLVNKKINAYFATDLNKSKLGYELTNNDFVLDILGSLDNLKKNYISFGDENSILEFNALRDEFLIAVSHDMVE